MKFIASSLVAIAMLAGTVATVSAAPYSGSAFERLDKDHRGGFGG